MPHAADVLIARAVRYAPRRVVAPVALRYIAGEGLDDALRVARTLDARGLRVTLDVLGEAVTDAAEAEAITAEHVDGLRALAAAGLEPHVSVKPSSLGAGDDEAGRLDRLRRIADAAAAVAGGVTVDMEDASTTDATLGLFQRLRLDGHAHVGIVLQARLRRTRADIAALAPLRPRVRLCKGVYREPEDVAYTDDAEIETSFVACLDDLIAAGARPEIATHADTLLAAALARVGAGGGLPAGYEFQTLLGVRPDIADRLAASGHPVRVYVPYGTRWHAYSVRRLAESPHLAGHVARAVVTRGLEDARGLAGAVLRRLPGRG